LYSDEDYPKCDSGSLVYYNWKGWGALVRYRSCDEEKCDFDERVGE